MMSIRSLLEYIVAAMLLSVPSTALLAQAKIKAADRPFDCYDRCTQAANTCFGVPPKGGPLTPIPPPGSNSDVPTPPPYEFCLAELQLCNAQCDVESFRKLRRPR